MEHVKASGFSIQSYTDEHREKIDESLVSLRFMKEVDTLLDYKNLSNRDLASKLGCSESYISQLMTGVKKINTSFINKLEKKLDVKVDFRFFLKKEECYLQSLPKSVNVSISLDKGFHPAQPIECFVSVNSPTTERVLNLDRDTYKKY